MPVHESEGPYEIRQAAKDLDALQQFEAELSNRARGLAFMLWAFILGALQLSIHLYGIGRHSLRLGPVWAGPALWLALALGGVIATNAIWRLTALKTGRGFSAGRIWAHSLGILVAVFLLQHLLEDHILRANFNLVAMVVAGLVMVGLGFTSWQRSRSVLLLGIGLALTGSGALFIAILDKGFVPDPTAVAIGALAPGLAYFAAGILLFRRG